MTRMSVRSTVGVAEQVDARPVDERVAVGAGEDQGTIGELRREGAGHVPEAVEVVRVEVDDEPVRDERPVGGGQALGLHRALDPALELDRLESGPEQARGRSLEEAFEEPLDGGERRHGRSRRLAEGPPSGPSSSAGPDHPRVVTAVPPAEGRGGPCGYTLAPFGRPVRPNLSSARSRGHDARDPDRILLRTVRHALHVRIGRPAGAPGSRASRSLSRGLKNFVMSDDTSMDEAMAAARSETDREQSRPSSWTRSTRPSTSA